MLVDDAVVVRHVLTETLSKDPGLEVVGTASDGKIALELLPTFKPDVVVLDVEMPNMDGIETLAAIKATYPKVKVIMFSTLTSRGAAATMDALMMGADDYVCKPGNVGSIAAAIEKINEELVPKIKALHSSSAVAPPAPAQRAPVAPSASARFGAAPPAPATRPITSTPTTSAPVAPLTPMGASTGRPQILAIAVSTGGPNALASLMPQLPRDLAVPIVIVQHIPPMFSKALADRLDSKSALHVAECEPGAVLKPGDVWIAPGDFHMLVKREGQVVRLETNQNPPENSCRPAADVLLRSVAEAYGGNCLGLVLTGMGTDGLKGSQEIVRVGGKVIVQDEATSVVWGMPGAVANAGIADRTLPLDQIAAEIVKRTGTTGSPANPSIHAINK